ncbi:MAG TPA: carboxymuconolactone decarboxylase family protein [Gemmatimonadaceae bacterium]|jgi:AhpD family alkylhydroperoxidase
MTQRSAYEINAIEGMRTLGAVYAYVAKSGLPKALLDLVYLRASQINGCAFCVDAHSHDLAGEGVVAEKLNLVAVWREAGAWFSATEGAALAWTECITNISVTHAPQADYDAARAHFDEKQLADLTIAIGLINVYNRIAIAFRRPPNSLRKLSAAEPVSP